jgi:hypothetical protein
LGHIIVLLALGAGWWTVKRFKEWRRGEPRTTPGRKIMGDLFDAMFKRETAKPKPKDFDTECRELAEAVGKAWFSSYNDHVGAIIACGSDDLERLLGLFAPSHFERFAREATAKQAQLVAEFLDRVLSRPPLDRSPVAQELRTTPGQTARLRDGFRQCIQPFNRALDRYDAVYRESVATIRACHNGIWSGITKAAQDGADIGGAIGGLPGAVIAGALFSWLDSGPKRRAAEAALNALANAFEDLRSAYREAVDAASDPVCEMILLLSQRVEEASHEATAIVEAVASVPAVRSQANNGVLHVRGANADG